MRYICKDCGKQFEISDSEAEFFKKKGLSLPKRCKECREKNKAKRNSSGNTPTDTKKQTENSNGNKQKGRGSKGRYTAVLLLLAVLILGMVFGGKSLLGNSDFNDLTGTPTQAESAENGTDIFNPDEYTSEYTYSPESTVTTRYSFRNDDLLENHYKKHGIEMGFSSKEEYEAAASAVIDNPEALTKTEAEDGDFVYYLEDTNEFVILSTDGYIRTYFCPEDGIDYFERQ